MRLFNWKNLLRFFPEEMVINGATIVDRWELMMSDFGNKQIVGDDCRVWQYGLVKISQRSLMKSSQARPKTIRTKIWRLI